MTITSLGSIRCISQILENWSIDLFGSMIPSPEKTGRTPWGRVGNVCCSPHRLSGLDLALLLGTLCLLFLSILESPFFLLNLPWLGFHLFFIWNFHKICEAEVSCSYFLLVDLYKVPIFLNSQLYSLPQCYLSFFLLSKGFPIYF